MLKFASKSGFKRCAVLAFIAFAAGNGWGQSWPSKPVRLVVPFAPGGSTDLMARVLAPMYSRIWGQPVIIENRLGAGGHIGAEMVARSAPDGLILLMTSSNQAAGPALYKKLNYDPVRDLAPISGLIVAPSIVVANLDLPVKSLADFIALAKAQPGKFNYGSSGVGSSPQFAFEFLKSVTGIDVVHIPFNGDGPLYPALISDQVQIGIFAPQAAMPYIKSGRIRPLAVTSTTRFAPFPDLPPAAESGAPGFEHLAWVGLFAAAGTPRSLTGKISADTAQIMQDPEVVNKHLPAWGVSAMPLSPEAFTARYMSDIERFTRIAREARIPQTD